MDAALTAFLHEVEAAGRQHDASEPEHQRRLLNLEPETALLVSILVRAGQRRRILEIGTSNGYSTMWLAWSAAATGGRVTSVEREDWKLALAAENLRRAGLDDLIELRAGDALAIVPALAGPFDLVFLDADRRIYPELLGLLLPQLAPDALLLADNVLSHPDEMAAYLDLISATPEFDHLVVPVGKGLSVAYRQPGPG